MEITKDKELDKSYIDVLEEARKEFPKLNLPSMGIFSNDDNIDINIDDYFIQDNQKENGNE